MNIIQDWRCALFSVVFFVITGTFMYLSYRHVKNKSDDILVGMGYTLAFFNLVIGIVFFMYGFSK